MTDDLPDPVRPGKPFNNQPVDGSNLRATADELVSY
jgi:hypothetical protein